MSPRKITREIETPKERMAIVGTILGFSNCVANVYFDQLDSSLGKLEPLFSASNVQIAFPDPNESVNSHLFHSLICKTSTNLQTLIEFYGHERIVKMMEFINHGVSQDLNDDPLREMLITGVLGIYLDRYKPGNSIGVNYVDRDFLHNLYILTAEKCNLILDQGIDFEDGTGGDSLLLFFLDRDKLEALGLHYE